MLRWIVAVVVWALASAAAFAQVSPESPCVTNAYAQGTGDAITIPALPCALTTNLLLLSVTASNTSGTVTLQPLGLAAQSVVRFDGAPLSPGDLVAGGLSLLSPTGTQWVLMNPATGAYSFTATGAGAVTWDLVARGQTTINLLDYATPALTGCVSGQGNGTCDDGPMIRAAITACNAGNAREIYIPQASARYVVKTLDGSGLGGLVIGAGQTCKFVAEGPAVVIQLGDGLNRPLVYVASCSYSPEFVNIGLIGNKTGQSGWAGGPGGKLNTVQIADADGSCPGTESALIGHNLSIKDGYNGNLYLGAGRGSLWLNDGFISGSGQTTADASLFLNGYDATIYNPGIGSNVGTGIYVAQGSQYQIIGGAIFYNTGSGIISNGGAVNYLSVVGTNIQYNSLHGVQVYPTAPYAGMDVVPIQLTSVVFDGNSKAANNTYSDITTASPYGVNCVNCSFVGNSVYAASWLPAYNISTTGSGVATTIGTGLSNNSSAATSFTNNLYTVSGDWNGGVTQRSKTQYTGFLLNNGTYYPAKLYGATASNDNGSLALAFTNTTGVQLTASGASYFNGGDVSFGTTSDLGSSLGVAGSFATKAPSTVSAGGGSCYSVAQTDSSLVFSPSSNCTITLPAASGFSGRILHLKNLSGAFTVLSGASNVVPRTSATPGTAILAATAGAWVELQSDGTNWVVMAGN